MKKLGFGMMRLPLTDPKVQGSVDLSRVCAMVDAFLERGYTYFDTAFMYHGGESEHVVRRTLVERHPRDCFTLADKMPLFHFKPEDTARRQEEIFAEQLEKCGVDYFDYYLLHSLTAESYETAGRLDTFAFLSRKKAEGKIRHLGFSFHDKADVLDRILREHPEAEFVQLQINYLDWEDERVQSRKCYETVRRHGKQVVHDAGEALAVQVGKIPGKLDCDQFLLFVHAKSKASGVAEKIVGGKELQAERLAFLPCAGRRQQGDAGLEYNHAGTFNQADLHLQPFDRKFGLTGPFLDVAGAARGRGVVCDQCMQCLAHGHSSVWKIQHCWQHAPLRGAPGLKQNTCRDHQAIPMQGTGQIR